MRSGRKRCSALLLVLACCAQAPPGVEDEVLGNLRDQPVGRQRLADFAFPEAFLRRIADRIIRSSWQERYHGVIDTGGSVSPTVAHRPPSTHAAAGPAPLPRVIAAAGVSEEVAAYRRTLVPGRPELRGFRAPILDRAGEPWPVKQPGAEAPAALAQAADLVGTALSRDGLIATLAAVVPVLGVERMRNAGAAELAALREAGLPVDWLAYFEPGAPRTTPSPDPVLRVVRHVAERVGRSDPPDPGATLRFRFRPTRPGWRVALESGERDPGLLRLQLSRGDYWGGPGDGGSVDIARQLMAALTRTRFLVSIEQRYVGALQSVAGEWELPSPERVSLLAEPTPVTQWAQDNGKAGVLLASAGSNPVAATLAPRFASRREDGSEFLPGESFLLETVAAAGHPVFQSPLLFQGGDLLAARHPGRGTRILFMGEAELYRNTSLGLSREQVLEAFGIEFGVDRVVVLPSVSFHIDFDVSFRAQGDELLALVNDREAAARLVFGMGLDVLGAGGTLEDGVIERGRGHLREGRDHEAAETVATELYRLALPSGGFPVGPTSGFAAEGESAVDAAANFQRFLVALDVLYASGLGDAEVRDAGHRSAYFRSLIRHGRLRARLHALLETEGCRVVPVPGFSEGMRSLGYLNGIHTRRGYLMPAYGGFYAPIDAAARDALGAAIGGPDRVTPILTTESQRRLGGLHCSAAAYPTTHPRPGGPER